MVSKIFAALLLSMPDKYFLYSSQLFICSILVLNNIASRFFLISLFKAKSRELYNYYQQAEENINKICLGIHTCGECQGNNCIVGFTKTLIKKGLKENEPSECETFVPKEEALSKQ